MENNHGKNDELGQHFEQFIATPLIIMRSIGIDLFKDIPWRFQGKWMRYYLVLVLAMNLYCTGGLLVQTLKHVATLDVTNLPFLFEMISNFGYTFCGCLKMIIFINTQNQLESLLLRFHDLSTRSDSFAGECRFIWPKWVVASYGLYLLACSSIVILPISNSIWDLCLQLLDQKDMANIDFLYLHVFQAEYGFNYRSPFGYLLLLIIEIICIHGNVILNFCPDLWLQCLIIQLCKHYDNLMQSIENYQPMTKSLLGFRTLSVKDHKFLEHFIIRHKLLLR